MTEALVTGVSGANNICPDWESCILHFTGDDDTTGDFQAGNQDFQVPSIYMLDPLLALLRILSDDACGLI